MESNLHIQSLAAMGLSPLEAEVYAHLLKRSPMTGYGVAKALGRTGANVYKAIDSLARKGAVVVDDGGTRQCRAVPAKEFLVRLERDFVRHRRDAEATLERLPSPGDDAGIYRLRSAAQVFERCRRLFAEAKRVIHADVFPDPLEELRDDIAGAAVRGVQVVIKTYRPVEINGVEILVEPEAAKALERWPGQWVDIAIDGSRYVMAFLSLDSRKVIQGVSSASPGLSYIHFDRLAYELGYTALRIAFTSKASRNELIRTFAHTREYFAPNAAGYARLLQQAAAFEEASEVAKS
jgi:sugar-specific transcriptional regulator TrmB